MSPEPHSELETTRSRRSLSWNHLEWRAVRLALLLPIVLFWGGCARPEPDRQAEARSPRAPLYLDPAILAERSFGEAPVLAERVVAGELPPVADRLPDRPRVIVPIDQIGQYGGSIRRALAADIEEEDAVYKTLTDSLMIFERPVPRSIELNLAENFEFQYGGRVALFKLRKGIRWSDGQPLTTADFLFWYEDMTFDENARSLALFPSEWLIDGEPIRMEAVDDLTLKFSASKPMGRLLHALCKDPIAYPKHYYSRYHPRYNPEATYEDFRSRTSEAALIMEPGVPVLSAWGAVNWSHGQRIVYERNPYYWKVDTAGNQLPYADQLVFDIVPNGQIFYLQFLNGQVDIVGRRGLLDIIETVRLEEPKGLIKARVTGPERGTAFYLNWDALDPLVRGAIRDKNVRMALSHAINREELSEVKFKGTLVPGGYSFSQLSPYFSEAAYQSYSEYDPEKSRLLLDQAGYLDGDGDGWREFRDGTPFRLVIDSIIGPGGKDDLTELVRDYWQAIGIEINLNYGLGEMIYPRRLNGEFEILTWGLEAPDDPLGRPQVWATMAPKTPFWHRNAARDGPAWLREATDLIKNAMATVDPDEVRELMVKVRDLHTENIPVIYLGSIYHVWGFNTRLGNVPRENTLAHVFRGWSGPLMSEQIFIRQDIPSPLPK
jgi:peptide/nickel transport system substrate-binding protein